MDCRRFQEDIAEYLLNDPCLSVAHRQEMQSHTATCSKCHEVYDETKWIIELIRENKERVRRIICGGEEKELPNAADRMSDEDLVDALANMAPAEEPPEQLEAGWQRLKARMEAEDEAERRQVSVRRKGAVRRGAAIAASVLIVLGLGFVAVTRFSSPGPVEVIMEAGSRIIPFGREIRTDSSERKTLHLGTRHLVVANSGTAFTVNPLHQGLRTGYALTLKTGELYIEVTHDGNPFTVRTPDAEAIITGTNFDIRAVPSQTNLTLVEGSVQFFAGDGTSVVVTTGQMSSVAAGAPPSTPQPVDSLATTAWARGTMVRDAFARRNIVADDAMVNSITENWPSPAPPDPEKLDYATWRDSHRQWFSEQFPWIFRAQAALKTEHGIQADYIELLMLSGDVWQFHYSGSSHNRHMTVFDPSAVDRLAKDYGVASETLMLAAKPAGWAHPEPSQMVLGLTQASDSFLVYRDALQGWRSDMTAAENRAGEPLSGDLLFFSIGACQYLANTRTAAYLWIREHPKQAERMLADPAYMSTIAGMFPMRETLSAEKLTATLSEQSVSVGKAQNRAVEQLMNLPEAEKDRCRYSSRERAPDKLISKMLAPLVE